MGAMIGSSFTLDTTFGDAAVQRGVPRGWDFLGNVPVPLRHCVRDGTADAVARHRAAGGPSLKCCFPMGQGGRTPFDRLRFVRALDDFPNMLVSAEHGNAFNRRFHEKHVVGGAFSGYQSLPNAGWSIRRDGSAFSPWRPSSC
jgi:hypothetical protein